MRIRAILKGPYDSHNALLALHAGAGGTEACDWCSMLYRMYTRYCEKMGFKVFELDREAGDEAGIKSIDFRVEGENAYGYLKAEMGVHRLVRISPFDANKRRHTSFCSLEVMPEVEDDNEVEIKDDDIRIDIYHSGGAAARTSTKWPRRSESRTTPRESSCSARTSVLSSKIRKCASKCSVPNSSKRR